MYRMYASVEDQGPLKQLSSALAQSWVSTPEAPKQLGVHEVPVHVNWHVKLHTHSASQGHSVHATDVCELQNTLLGLTLLAHENLKLNACVVIRLQ